MEFKQFFECFILRAFDGPFDSVDSLDFSTFYTTLPHNIIKQKSFPILLNGRLVNICCNSFKAFFSNEKGKNARYNYWRCDETIEAVSFLLGNINVRFGDKVYRQAKRSRALDTVLAVLARYPNSKGSNPGKGRTKMYPVNLQI